MPVTDTHADYDVFASLWRTCRDASAGQEWIHAGGERYLPRLSGQSDTDYRAYRKRALFYNATRRTIAGLTGLIFRKPADVAVPPAAQPLLEDVDRAGTPMDGFAQKLVGELLEVGRAGVLVDFPATSGHPLTRDAARMAGLRPHAVLYRAEDIIDWRMGTIGSACVPVHVRLAERVTAPGADEFSHAVAEQVRVLDLDAEGYYRQRLFRPDGEGTYRQVAELAPLLNGRRLTHLPFLFVGPAGLDVSVARPPLLDLVHVNLAHYRTSADFEHGAHFTGLPTAVITGHRLEADTSLAIGSGEAWVFPEADAQAEYLEFSGQGLSALERSMERKEGQMAALGARLLAPEKRQVEAAETAAIHRAGEHGVLATLALSASRALTVMTRLLVRWQGLAVVDDDVRIALNTDYLPTPLTAQEITALLAAVQAGELSRPAFFDALKRGEVIRPDMSFETHHADLASLAQPE